MSMYESAQKINEDLRNLFGSIPINQFNTRQRQEILNILIRFGAVAKFRCRSNVAYENFVNACLRGIATTKRVVINEEREFSILQAEVKA